MRSFTRRLQNTILTRQPQASTVLHPSYSSPGENTKRLISRYALMHPYANKLDLSSVSDYGVPWVQTVVYASHLSRMECPPIQKSCCSEVRPLLACGSSIHSDPDDGPETKSVPPGEGMASQPMALMMRTSL